MQHHISGLLDVIICRKTTRVVIDPANSPGKICHRRSLACVCPSTPSRCNTTEPFLFSRITAAGAARFEIGLWWLQGAFTSRARMPVRPVRLSARVPTRGCSADTIAPKVPAQFFFSTSFCTLLPISSKRRQTFSRNETTLSTSASLGSLSSGSPGLASDGTPGNGSPRAKSSFFSVTREVPAAHPY
jgi:hypothetical protein